MPTVDDFNFPPLIPQVPIVDLRTGAATPFFQDQWNDLGKRLVSAINALNASVRTLQVAQQATISSQQQTVTVAQSSAAAQASADTGGPAQSADFISVVDVLGGTGWVAGPQVNLAGVVAGNLSIANSGPVQASGTIISGPPGDYTCSWRIQEIAGGPEVTVFTGSFTATISRDDVGNVAFVFNNSSAETTAPIARATVGAVDYRIDFNSPTVSINGMEAYIYARRS